MKNLLYRLTGHLPCRLIKLDGDPYLERYYVGQLFGVTFYLHRFVSSDSERHVHNHPWGWGRALVLAGGYLEERVQDLCPAAGPSGCVTETKPVRWWNRVDGNDFHRIVEAEPETWTLFMHGERLRVGPILKGSVTLRQLKGWGFLERVQALDDTVTVFRSYPGAQLSAPRWWQTAPNGSHVGRQLLTTPQKEQ